MDYLEFIEVLAFQKAWKKIGLDETDLLGLQKQLMENPHEGTQIGILRKVRFASNEGQGKSGGARVIYLYAEHKKTIYLIFCYPKNVQENFSPEQKKMMNEMARKLLNELDG